MAASEQGPPPGWLCGLERLLSPLLACGSERGQHQVWQGLRTAWFCDFLGWLLASKLSTVTLSLCVKITWDQGRGLPGWWELGLRLPTAPAPGPPAGPGSAQAVGGGALGLQCQRTQLPPRGPARRPPPAVRAVPASTPSLPRPASGDGPGPHLSGMGKAGGWFCRSGPSRRPRVSRAAGQAPRGLAGVRSAPHVPEGKVLGLSVPLGSNSHGTLGKRLNNSCAAGGKVWVQTPARPVPPASPTALPGPRWTRTLKTPPPRHCPPQGRALR